MRRRCSRTIVDFAFEMKDRLKTKTLGELRPNLVSAFIDLNKLEEFYIKYADLKANQGFEGTMEARIRPMHRCASCTDKSPTQQSNTATTSNIRRTRRTAGISSATLYHRDAAIKEIQKRTASRLKMVKHHERGLHYFAPCV